MSFFGKLLISLTLDFGSATWVIYKTDTNNKDDNNFVFIGSETEVILEKVW